MSVNQTPHANAGDFNVETTEICQGDSTIFEVANSVGDFHKWYRSIDGGTTLAPLTVGVIQDTIIKRTTPKNSFDEITYYHETGNACDTAISSITFYLDENPVAGTLITPSISICEGASTYLKLNNTNADYYEWEYCDGTSWSDDEGLASDSVNLTVSDTIIYRVLAYFYESTCRTPDTSNSVTINSTPSSESATLVTANTEICASDSITLQYTGGIGAAKWFVSENGAPYLQTVFPSMVGDSIANNVVFTNSGNTPIVYDVYVQTSTSCDSAYSDTITIKVNPKPIITSLTDTASCDQYLLPTITGVGLSGNEAYYTQPNGNGIQYLANDLITNTTTLYLYDESGTTPNCSDEKPVTITIDSTNSVNAGPDQTICANNPNVALNGSSSNGSGTVWSSNGTGIFMPNATSPNTQYVPSNTDIQTGTITLSLTATATGACPNTSDDLILNITPAPVVDAGADIALCSDNSTINLNGIVTQSTGGIWTGGLGTFSPNATTLTANYTPSPAEIQNGTITLTLTSTGNGICLPEQDLVNINIIPALIIDDLTDQIVCDSFLLPTITGTNLTGNEAYYLLQNGGGSAYAAGDYINTSSTIYIFDQTNSTPSCTAESSFELTINSTPSIDEFVNVVECASYTLPTISGNLTGNEAYYDAENGLGNSYQAGEVITESITLYVFDQTATTPNCTSEISFDISISSPTLSLIDDTISVIAGSPIAIPVTENDTINGIISLIRVLNENPVTETATIQGNTVVYTSSNGFKGGVTIDYEITDECNTDTASVYITVENTNPIAKDTTLELGSQTTI